MAARERAALHGGSRSLRRLAAGARASLAALVILATATTAGPEDERGLSIVDLGLESGFQDYWGNHYRRGRSIVADDFDGDGRLDYFIGNPGDESFVFRNLGPGPEGIVRFGVAQVLLDGDLAFAASGADYDNDGDLDLFVGCGGLDGECLDFLFRNDSVPGSIRFTDVTSRAGIAGPAPFGDSLIHATGGGTWGDYDRDGDPDLFVSLQTIEGVVAPTPGILWRNIGGGSFYDATSEAGLDEEPEKPDRVIDFSGYQNSTWIDADNDGDLDLFLNNAMGPNSLRQNLLVEQGEPRFVDATRRFAPPGEDLRFPLRSFASGVADFDNDGRQDLVLFAYGFERASSPYGSGNALFLNREGSGFVNVAARAGISAGHGGMEMSMGSQAADLDADGRPDLAIGSGDPMGGATSRLLLGARLDDQGVPLFDDASEPIDFPPTHGIDPAAPPYPEIPPYPYRGHGMAAGDADGDGHLELAVVNGGPAASPAIVREPNRLFRFSGAGLGATFRVRLEGNGRTDGRDGIGARAYVEVPASAGPRRIFQTVLAGSGFSAQNERTLTFGLGRDTSVSRLAILWPSGCLQVIDDPRSSPFPLVVGEDCWTCPAAPGPVQAWLEPDRYGCATPPTCRIEGRLSDGTGPVPWSRAVQRHGESIMPIEARSAADGTFALEHPYRPGLCRVTVLEPFGYLPVPNPVWEREDTVGTATLHVVLTRAPEGRQPRGAGYWMHQAEAMARGDGRHAHAEPATMAAWSGEIRARYPGLGGFESPEDLAAMLQANPAHLVAARLRRHLGAALLNLASGRLSSFTLLGSRERVADLVESAYVWLTSPGGDPEAASRLAADLEDLNEGLLFASDGGVAEP